MHTHYTYVNARVRVATRHVDGGPSHSVEALAWTSDEDRAYHETFADALHAAQQVAGRVRTQIPAGRCDHCGGRAGVIAVTDPLIRGEVEQLCDDCREVAYEAVGYFEADCCARGA